MILSLYGCGIRLEFGVIWSTTVIIHFDSMDFPSRKLGCFTFHIGSHSRTFRTVSQHRQVPSLITDKLSLLVNCRVKLTSTSREECVGSTTLALKLGGSLAPSSGPFQLARVSSARDEIPCRHTFLARSVGPHNHHGSSQQQRHPYAILWRSTWWR